jgi:hypothetical protein
MRHGFPDSKMIKPCCGLYADGSSRFLLWQGCNRRDPLLYANIQALHFPSGQGWPLAACPQWGQHQTEHPQGDRCFCAALRTPCGLMMRAAFLFCCIAWSNYLYLYEKEIVVFVGSRLYPSGSLSKQVCPHVWLTINGMLQVHSQLQGIRTFLWAVLCCLLYFIVGL